MFEAVLSHYIEIKADFTSFFITAFSTILSFVFVFHNLNSF